MNPISKVLIFSLLAVLSLSAQEEVEESAKEAVESPTEVQVDEDSDTNEVLEEAVEPEAPAMDTNQTTIEDVFPDHESARFRFILPMEGDVIHTPDLQAVISLGKEAFSSVSILLDGYPLPQPAESKGSILTASLSGMSHGIHRLSVVFLDENSKILYKKEIPFFVQLPEPERTEESKDFKQSGVFFLQSEYRGTSTINNIVGYKPFESSGTQITQGELDEKIAPKSNSLAHTSYKMKYKELELQGRLALNTRESPYQQPYHRLSGKMDYGPYATLAGGDIYPYMNELMLKDTRVRGGETQLRLVLKDIEWTNLQVVYGDIRREVDPHVLIYESSAGRGEDTIPGTFQRRLAAARLGFGARHHVFNFGVSLLRSRDQTPEWDSLLYFGLPHYSKEENVVAGTDFQLSLWKHRIALYTDAAYGIWTSNLDAAILGSNNSRIDFTPGNISPEDLKDYITLNASSNIDYDNPLRNLALQSGVRASLPFTKINSETEVFYYQTGDNYRSEGNPFINNTGETGVKLLERVKLLENRLSVGIETGIGKRDLITLDTLEQGLDLFTFKSDIRYSPQANLPSLWVGLSQVKNEPTATGKTITPRAGFENKTLYVGGYHNLILGPGKMYAGASYSLSQNINELFASSLDTLGSDTTFESKTHIVSASLQYRRPNARLVPFLRYSLTANDVRLALSNVTIGTNLFFSNRLSTTASFLVGQYPTSSVQNDLRVGETLILSYSPIPNHSLYLQQKLTRNGEDFDVDISGNYEVYF